MLSFPLLVIVNHTNIKLAARRAKIEGYFICRILYASLLHLLPFVRQIGGLFRNMASKHTKGCFLQPNRTCFEFKQILSNASLTKFPRNRVL